MVTITAPVIVICLVIGYLGVNTIVKAIEDIGGKNDDKKK